MSADTETVEKNLALMQHGDDGSNSGDWSQFAAAHTDEVTVYMPGAAEPTHGIEPHLRDARAGLRQYVPDFRIHNRPYAVTFGQGEWTCAVAYITGTMTKPMPGPDGKLVPPTNKAFKTRMSTAARWVDGRIAEEHIFVDMISLWKQIGVL